MIFILKLGVRAILLFIKLILSFYETNCYKLSNIMGIENFHTWIRQKYARCFLNSKIKFDYIYVDINHILHNSIYGCKDEKEFIQKIYFHLDLLFNNYLAIHGIFIAIDGPAPYSKVLLQRKRRMQSIKNYNSSELSAIDLTPGTRLMENVNSSIKRYLDNLSNHFLFLNPTFSFKDVTNADEGEIKIQKALLENSKNDPQASHLIVGNDSDLVVLASAVQHITNTYVLCKNKNSNEIISVQKLMKLIRDEYLTINNCIENVKDNLHLDFVILSIMIGNDYLPKLNYVNFNILWKSYFDTKHLYPNLIEGNTFNTDFFIAFLSSIICRIRPPFRKFNKQKFNRSNIKNYLEGLLWCLEMYRTGECPMYDYFYCGDSSVGPIEVLHFLIINNDKIEIPRSDTEAISPEIYTLLLIPKKARSLIPDKYQKLIDCELKEYFDNDECCEFKNLYSNQYSNCCKEQKKFEMENSDTEVTRTKISEISKRQNKHKLLHQVQKFDINSVKKIIEITQKII